jgi:RNA-binding protein
MPLTSKQRQHLKGLAHHLDPVVHVGHDGLTDAVIAQISEALEAHELIKIRLGKECPVGKDEAAAAIASGARAEIPQTIGHIVVAYRKRPKKKAKVELPEKAGNVKGKKKEKRGRGQEGSKGRRPPRPPRGRSGAKKKRPPRTREPRPIVK